MTPTKRDEIARLNDRLASLTAERDDARRQAEAIERARQDIEAGRDRLADLFGRSVVALRQLVDLAPAWRRNDYLGVVAGVFPEIVEQLR